HGMEFRDRFGAAIAIEEPPDAALALEKVRGWLAVQVPPDRGFRIEDKGDAIGLHYRLAQPREARELGAQFAEFVGASAPELRMLHLKKLLEVMPLAAGKGRAVTNFKRQIPASFVCVCLGDDRTDEDMFAALKAPDHGILVGRERASHARYRLPSPRAVARELLLLASTLEGEPLAPEGIAAS